MNTFAFTSASTPLSADQAEKLKELLVGTTDHLMQAVSDPQAYIDEACAAFSMPESFEVAANRLSDPPEQDGDQDSPAAPTEASPEDQAALGHYRAAQEALEALTRHFRAASEEQVELIGSLYEQYCEATQEMVNGQIQDYVERLDSGEFESVQAANDAMRQTGNNIRTATGRVQATVLGPDQSEKLEQLKLQADKQAAALMEATFPPLSEFVEYACFERELIPEDEVMAYFQRIGEAVAGPGAEAMLAE